MLAAMELVKSVYDSVGAEILLFFLAFFLHFALFSERCGILRSNEAAKLKTKKKLISTSMPKSAKSCGGNNLARLMLSFLNEVPELDLKLTGNESAAEVQEMVASAGTDAELLLLQSAAQKNRSDILRSFFAAYGSPGQNQAALLRRLVRKGYTSVALECVQTQPRSNLYAGILEMAAEKKDLASTLKVLEAAKAAKLADTSCYNSLVRAYGALGQIDEAKKAMLAMLDAGFQPDTNTFNGLLEGYIKSSGDLQACLDLLGGMTKYNLKPTSMTCAILLKGIQKNCNARMVDRVLQIMDSRDESQVDDVLLGSLCEALTRSGHLALLVQRLKQLRQDGPLQVKCAHTVGSIIRAYGSQEDMDGVWQTWKSMKRTQLQPTRITIGCMVEALSWNNDPEGAYKIIQEVLADPETRELVNAVMYCSVMKTFNHQKKFSQVWSIHDEMMREKISLSVTTYNALLDVCARSGELQRMKPLLEDMVKQNITPSIITYGTVIKAYCSSNRLDEAFDAMESMKRAGIAADEVTYNTLLDGCARYGLFDRGIKVLESMRQEGVLPSNFTLSVLTKLANRSKQPAKAFELVDSLSKELQIRPNMHVYNNLIQAASLQSDLSQAQDVFASMLKEGVRPDGRSFSLLLRCCVSQRAPSEAMCLLRLALGLELQTEGMKSLNTELQDAIQGLRNISWSAAPKKGNGALDEDAVCDVFNYLSRLPTRNSLQVVQAWRMLKEVQVAMPQLKISMDIRTRLTANLSK